MIWAQVLAGAIVTDNIRPSVTSLSREGGWYDPVKSG